MIRDKCLICDSNNLVQIIDLGSHPFADTFVPESKISEPDLIYPLVCDLCIECGNIQTKYSTNPLDRYSNIDYSYTSSNSAFSRGHWEKYAQNITEQLNLKKNSFVVEIGSNDGYLTEQFLKNNNKVLGIDPSPYMAELAKDRNVPTIIGLFGTEYSREILDKYGEIDLVIANNVFNHSDNPLDFVTCVSNILKKDGSFVFEQPYWIDTLKSGKFDQIYHEHVSYFTVRSLKKLLARVGLVISYVKIVDYHGGSLRIIAQKKEHCKESESVEKMISEEQRNGAFESETYKKFMDKTRLQRSKFLERICRIKEEGYKIIAVGAAAKGNTFLNFYRLDNTLIDYVTDASPHKKGKYTPATRIPIVGDEIFSKFDKVYALILSWNIADILKEKLAVFNKNIEFISPESF
ncbi:class I SAM-dependent methyltransferase [Candidatus Pacearchaeota archaeon]|nr:class I SAM-dependent methyltransferase [Candidatus Pacearchaeota archaeon]